MSNLVAGPWQNAGFEGHLGRRDAAADKTVARVYRGPAGTFSSRTIARLGETSYGFASQHDAQRWADFEISTAGYTLTPGPLDPPPLVERRQRGCLAASLGLITIGLGLIAAAIGVGVWW